MWSDGRISIGQCDLVESWDNLSLSQKKNLNYRYQMGCECRVSLRKLWFYLEYLVKVNILVIFLSWQINTCYTMLCASAGENECLWTDWLLDNSLNGEQARQYACIRRLDTSCSWYRGGSPPEKDFLDMTDPWSVNPDFPYPLRKPNPAFGIFSTHLATKISEEICCFFKPTGEKLP